MLELNKIYNLPCEIGLKQLDNESIDLTVTSPPYDNLRDYKGYSFDFEAIAKELFRVTKKGGVVVWVVGDATVNGSETGTSFKQALYFKEIGFNLHDTMIYHRVSPFPSNVRYQQSFEYMFILSKGTPKSFNPCVFQIKSEKSFSKNVVSKTYRNSEGKTINPDNKAVLRLQKAQNELYTLAENIWYIPAGFMVGSKEKITFEHPATFPEKLVSNHINSWSNENEIVLDPFMGSGTTAKVAMKLNRKFIGFEISKEYHELAEKRIKMNVDLFCGDCR